MRSQTEYEEAIRLCRSGLTDGAVGEQTGIPRRTVSGWRRGEAGTGLRRTSGGGCGAKHDFGNLPKTTYAYLLGLYLGDGCISAAPKEVWRIRITLDSNYPEIIRRGLEALESIFPSNRASVVHRRGRCVDLSLWSKHIPCFFPQHGPGPKHMREIALTTWQTQLLAGTRDMLLKGLIHSDGTRTIAVERKGSYVRRAPRYSFSNRSEDIKSIFCESCDMLGIRWTRPSDREIAVYRKASVAKLDEFIGPKR